MMLVLCYGHRWSLVGELCQTLSKLRIQRQKRQSGGSTLGSKSKPGGPMDTQKDAALPVDEPRNAVSCFYTNNQD